MAFENIIQYLKQTWMTESLKEDLDRMLYYKSLVSLQLALRSFVEVNRASADLRNENQGSSSSNDNMNEIVDEGP